MNGVEHQAFFIISHHSTIFFLASSLFLKPFAGKANSLRNVEFGIKASVFSMAFPKPVAESEKNSATFFPDKSYLFIYVLIAGVGLLFQMG